MLLEKEEDLKIIEEAANGEELVLKTKQLKPNIVLADIMMPGINGIAAFRKIREENESTRCIALSTFDNEHLIVEAMEAGASGYIVKNAEKGEIASAIRTVNSGYPYYCKSTSLRVTRMLVKSSVNPYSKIITPVFSEREREIIKLICEEKTSEEIAKQLCIGVRTIESERAKILDKMKVKTPAGVVIYAIKNFLYYIS